MNLPNLDVNLCWHPLDDPARVDGWLSEQLSSGRTIAVDTETTGLEWWTPGFTRLLQFGTEDSGWAVPIEGFSRLGHHLMQRIVDAEVDVIFHNSPFDMHAISAAGLPTPDWRHVNDTMHLHHLHRSNETHGLKGIAGRTFGKWAYEGQSQLKAAFKETGTDWATIPVNHPVYWAYGVMDTCLTARVWEHAPFQETLAAFRPQYEMEMHYQAIMYAAEERGMPVDRDFARRTVDFDYQPRIDELRQVLFDFGIENPNSTRHVAGALMALGYEVEDWTDTGEAQMDRAVLEKIMAMGGVTSAAAEALVNYKRLVGWRDKYLMKFIESNGTLHPSIRTMGARTGRTSVTNPPVQQLPARGGKEIRDCIVAAPGNVLVSVDYSGQEARLFAHYANEPAMIKFFLQGDGDLHSYVADLVGIPRPVAKTINFALLFGAGPAKMAAQAGVSEGEMKGFLSQYHSTFSQVQPTMRAIERSGGERLDAGEGAYVTTAGGRRVFADPDKLYTLTNYLIQGSGADVLKNAACRLDAEGFAEYIMLPVHDELVFQLPEEDAVEMTREITDIMHDDGFLVPLAVEASEPVKRWGDAK